MVSSISHMSLVLRVSACLRVQVNITVNGTPVGIHMKIGDAGEAFFVIETDVRSNPISPFVPNFAIIFHFPSLSLV